MLVTAEIICPPLENIGLPSALIMLAIINKKEFRAWKVTRIDK
ncbi:unnamed protein product [marine sediment metagenome]|uniref:Uncharacterized protein n=1 Tax=marine sediment metagenome TaxID=412755 RepID=X0UQ87_9ZZZZ